MASYTFKDIEEFLLDDNLFQWAKYGLSPKGFSIESYKLQHPGCEERIDLAISVIRGIKVVENAPATTREYKMQSFNKMMSKLPQPVIQPRATAKVQTSTYRRTIAYLTSAAAILCLCFGTYHFLSGPVQPNTMNLSASVIDSLSRTGQVQIILDGEKTISFNKNDAEIVVKKDGTVTVDKELVATHKGSDITVNRIVVPYGKRSKMTLPDGSHLYINAGSCVSYATDFTQKRKLNVQGEVFLDVKKDSAHPFVVKTKHLEIKVLGTSFNVSDYAKNVESSVVLVRGSVDVKVDNKERKRLTPNQRLAKGSQGTTVNKVDVYNYICWKDDAMNFDGQKLSDVLKSLSTYYNIPIRTSGSIGDEKYYGSLDLNSTLDEILEFISLTTPLSINKQGNEIFITPQETK